MVCFLIIFRWSQYNSYVLQIVIFLEKALASKDKHKRDDDRDSAANSNRYTIFHALFEALKEKDKRDERR